jgi:hypothetical protein
VNESRSFRRSVMRSLFFASACFVAAGVSAVRAADNVDTLDFNRAYPEDVTEEIWEAWSEG